VGSTGDVVVSVLGWCGLGWSGSSSRKRRGRTIASLNDTNDTQNPASERPLDMADGESVPLSYIRTQKEKTTRDSIDQSKRSAIHPIQFIDFPILASLLYFLNFSNHPNSTPPPSSRTT
jgi:hypothetical protein